MCLTPSSSQQKRAERTGEGKRGADTWSRQNSQEGVAGPQEGGVGWHVCWVLPDTAPLPLQIYHAHWVLQHYYLLSVSHSVISDFVTPLDRSPLGPSVHGALQARILERVAISFSRESSRPRDRICIAGRFFTTWVTREAQSFYKQKTEVRGKHIKQDPQTLECKMQGLLSIEFPSIRHPHLNYIAGQLK